MTHCNVIAQIQHVHLEWGPEIMALWLHDMYLCLGLSPKATILLIREQGLDSPEKLRVLTDKNVDDNCNVMRKPGSKNYNGMPNRGQQFSVIVQENLKLVAFLFHHRCRCTFDGKLWECLRTQCIFQQDRWGLKTSCCLRSIRPTWQEQWRPSKSILDHVVVSLECLLHKSSGTPY